MAGIDWGDVHGAIVLASGIIPLLILIKHHRRQSLALSQWLWCLMPFAIIGAMFMQLLNLRGQPLAEWAFPGVATAIVIPFAPTSRFRSLLTGSAAVLALAMCLSFVEVTRLGYTAEPEALVPMSFVANVSTLKRARQAVEERAGSEGVIPTGRIEQDLDGSAFEARMPTLVRKWHTFWTRMYLVEWQRGIVWSTGERERGSPVIIVKREM